MIRTGSTAAIIQAARALIHRERAAGFPACPCGGLCATREAQLRALANALDTFDQDHRPPRPGPGRPPRQVDVARVRELRAQVNPDTGQPLSWRIIHQRTGLPVRTLRRALAQAGHRPRQAAATVAK